MYTYRQLEKGPVVIHDETGCTIVYHRKLKAYKSDELPPDWKAPYFVEWFAMSNGARERWKKASMKKLQCIDDVVICFELAPLSTTTVPVALYMNEPEYYNQEQGNKPMARFNEVYANATVSAAQSDASVQRDYLLSRLSNAAYPKYNELDKLFHRFVDNSPKTYKDLIDAIKSDKFTIDAKKAKRVDAAVEDDDGDFDCNYNFSGPFYGIIWSGNQFDEKAWTAARADSEKQLRLARDIIMTGDAAAGLAALQAFEAWLPTKETTTAQ